MGKVTWRLQPGVTRFGRGVVLSETRARSGSGKLTRWVKLLCDCTTIYEVRLQDLTKTRKPTRSCGCLMRETAAETMRRPEHLARLAGYNEAKRGQKEPVVPRKEARTKSGTPARRMSGHRNHPLYGTWSNMMTRCYNPKFKQFKDYGGRGIKVCERWHDPRLFIEDIEREIGSRLPGMTLDRIDNNSNYGPGKVKWSTQAEQVRNSRRYIDGNRSGPVYSLWWSLLHKRQGEVCERWRDFTAFSKDVEAGLGARPARHRFARLDDSRPYGPGNAAWVTGTQPAERGPATRQGQASKRAKPEQAAERAKPGPKNGHGMTGHPLYNTWKGLVHNHSGRVYEPWLEMRAFAKDIEAELGPKPAGMLLRLIDPDGRYEPGGVCWGKRGRPARAR